ncbi:hypothetical protein ACFHW2_24725 [Actinomadura sp. LOL_016]|uniref:hypothetical protein n=1 Tax=unclassified Actinomadura TaxID=2626254 RepID=UPI003A8074ED
MAQTSGDTVRITIDAVPGEDALDMALALTARVHGERTAKALQLLIEYDPQPPFDSGTPATASASTLRLAARMALGDAPFAVVRRITGHLLTARRRRPAG